MIDFNKYKLPMQISVALATNRPELMVGLVGLSAGEYELTRLILDLIADRQQLKEHIEELRQVVEMTVQSSEGVMRKLEQTMAKVPTP